MTGTMGAGLSRVRVGAEFVVAVGTGRKEGIKVAACVGGFLF